MSHSSPLQTSTPVHSTKAMLAYRRQAFARDQGMLGAVSMFGQLVIGSAFYLYGHVSTPGYLSILLLFPFVLLLLRLSRFLRQHAGNQGILAAAGPIPGKAAALILLLVFLLDAQMAAFAISAILSDALPHFSPLLTMGAVALIMAAAIGGEDPCALPRLARLMGWPLGIAIAFCALTAVPHGGTGYLFPLLGQGTGSIFRGALWMSGCAAGACCPLLLPQPESPDIRETKGKFLFRPLLWAIPAGAVYALISACLLPAYSLARPENLGFRLLLFAKISGSSLAWSLMVFAQLFLLLITLAAGVIRCAGLICRMSGRKKGSPLLTLGLLLLLVPASALKTLPIQDALLSLTPLRGGAVLTVLIILSLITMISKRRQA